MLQMQWGKLPEKVLFAEPCAKVDAKGVCVIEDDARDEIGGGAIEDKAPHSLEDEGVEEDEIDNVSASGAFSNPKTSLMLWVGALVDVEGGAAAADEVED